MGQVVHENHCRHNQEHSLEVDMVRSSGVKSERCSDKHDSSGHEEHWIEYLGFFIALMDIDVLE